MAKNKRIDGIDIAEDFHFQEREWRAQRIGWVVMGLLVLAALLGLFGKGVLANAEAGDPVGVLKAKYARLERYRSPTTIEVIVGPNQAKEGKITLALDRQFVDRIDLQNIDPEPESVKSEADRMLYEFEVVDATRPVHVYIEFEHEVMGFAKGLLGLEGGPQVTLNGLVYP